MTEKISKIVQLFAENPEAEKALKAATTIEDAVALLCQYGVETTVEEFKQMGREITSDELSEELLMMVSGGSWKGFWIGVRDFFQGFLDAF